MKKVKTIKEILTIIDDIGTEFPSNVYLSIEFKEIESIDDIKKLAKQERANLFEPSPSIPYYWMDWNVTKELNVLIRSKKLNYVLG